MATALAAYERHLASERDLAAHTVRAYLGDVQGMLAHAAALGHTELRTLDLRVLRSWLAKQQTLGKARTTMARRAPAVRVFTAWALRRGPPPAAPPRARAPRVPRRAPAQGPPRLRPRRLPGIAQGAKATAAGPER